MVTEGIAPPPLDSSLGLLGSERIIDNKCNVSSDELINNIDEEINNFKRKEHDKFENLENILILKKIIF